MVTRRMAMAGGATALATLGVGRWWGAFGEESRAAAADGPFAVSFTDAEWHKRLSPDQFAVLRKSGTERPFTSSLLDEHRHGVFTCAGCVRDLFSSETKFDSGTGWPSFWAPLDGAVREQKDTSFLMTRTAIDCGGCGGHLGHVFNDGPKPTGLRYCMNGVAMGFKPTAA